MTTKDKTFERSTVEIPMKIAKEIHLSAVNVLRAHTEHAAKLDENGRGFAMTNNVDVAISAWLLFQMRTVGLSPRQAMEAFVQLLCERILPYFISIPLVRKLVEEEIQEMAGSDEPPIIAQVNEMLKKEGLEPLLVAGSMQEIIDQLQGFVDSEGKTKQ